MNNDATPRPRSGGFPQTPATVAPRRDPASKPRASLPPAPENASAAPANPPRIPTTLIDAPQQRFYIFSIYLASWATLLWDWGHMVEGNGSPYWYFGKWVFLHFVFLYSVPWLRIPWLEFAPATISMVFFVHLALDWILMFRIPLPVFSWLLGFLSVVYDRELSISENSVRASSILHNNSLISGKQIINILPEGSAIFNPDHTPYCLGEGLNSITVPLYFNATTPAQVELARMDLQTNKEEIISLTRSQMREIGRAASKCCDEDSDGTYRYDVPIKATGAYRLHRVLDEYKLEVQRQSQPTYVVSCPKAKVLAPKSNTRCLGELSDLVMEVNGTPPLKIFYSRTINGKDHGIHYQYLQPDGFSSPLIGARSQLDHDVTWLREQKVDVRLNESMTTAGSWQYSIDEVHDVFGNVVNYNPSDDPDAKPKNQQLTREFEVKKRPRAYLEGCDQSTNPLKVADGDFINLPVRYGDRTPQDAAHTMTYLFSPIDTLTKSGDHGDAAQEVSFTAKNTRQSPRVSAAGLYTLKSITCETCEGEVEEPSSCLLLHPLKPTMSMRSEEIAEKCAGNPIGLRVDLDLTGTPPFEVFYEVVDEKNRRRSESVKVHGLRHQLELSPRTDGRYQYHFKTVLDELYRVDLTRTDEYKAGYYSLEQYVKPPASATFTSNPSKSAKACLGEQIDMEVRLRGDGPFTLEWELVHEGKRKSEKATGISGETFTISTAPLTSGGEYIVALKSIKDKTGCPIYLKEQRGISVRRQQPRAGFGLLDGKRSLTVIEGADAKIPLRLSGDGPFSVTYQNVNGTSAPQTRVIRSNNDYIDAKGRGTYEITSVRDEQCPGLVDPKASTFDVSWFPWPELSLVPSDTITDGAKDRTFIKKDICQGGIDGFDISLQGSSPFHVQYKINHKPKSGSGYVAEKQFDAASSKASIPMDTSKAGKYTYTFSALSDNLYNDVKSKSRTPLTLEQTVHPNPSASFVKPSQTFKLCQSEFDSEERIPIKLEGLAPFHVEFEVKHSSSHFPEIFRVPNIPSNSYGIQLPRQHLKLGSQQIRIRKVSDSRGCNTQAETNGPGVQVYLYEAPTIYPLEQRTDYCVGERISYTLAGTPPFEIEYTFAGAQRKAKSQTTNFRRIAESPGDFTITSISDKASECRAAVHLPKTIHPMPSVKISQGKVTRVDIHEGSEVEIHFEFWGTPPFEFSYTRSSNAKKGQRSVVLETRHETSDAHHKVISASLEGTYEVVAIRDAHCSFSTIGGDAKGDGDTKAGKLLAY